MNHTPGPWKAKGPDGKYDNRRNSWAIHDDDASSSMASPITLEDGTVIAFAVSSSNTYVPEDLTEANARLIAAAPDLLEALRAINALAMSDGLFDILAVNRQVMAAIAKATGEQT